MQKKLLSTKFILLTVWLLAVFLRLHNFLLLPIDAHPMRQTDTESVAYYFATVDANPLHPQASLIRPQTNVHGYFFLEFPAYQYLLSIFYRVFGASVIVAHTLNLVLFSLSYWLLFRFVKQFISERIALWSAIVFSFLPTSLFFFGHAIHPDLFSILLVLCSLFFLSQQKHSFGNTLIGGALFALSVGTRPFILMALPSLLVVKYFNKGKWWDYLFIVLSSLSIYGFWVWWQQFFPEANASWQLWTLQGREVLYTFEGWKFLLWRNTSGEVVGRISSGLSVIGGIAILVSFLRRIFTKNSLKEKLLSFIHHVLKSPDSFSLDARLFAFGLPWLAAVPVYWWVVPAGNTAHQYYANVFVLPIILLAARGVTLFTTMRLPKYLRILLSASILLALLYNGIRTSEYFYQNLIPQTHLHIAQEIAQEIPAGAKIVYLATNNSVPFSLAHRQGWMLGGAPTDVSNTAEAVLNMKQYGATYAVWAKENNDFSKEELIHLELKSKKIYQSATLTIFQL